ncbi:unnamed protein product [Microthlaspi erraticum]|uniref:F-box domain-containing protein n=1 Tax=Microthlaspi erraticum TaxID=1685480 RepID=A0A6D2K9L1_9BRAS|nr:unnamed protein product [Microthlaspi erraticum]
MKFSPESLICRLLLLRVSSRTSISLMIRLLKCANEAVSKLQLSSSSPSAKMAQQPVTKEHTLSVPDWSLLPQELLQIISLKLGFQNICRNINLDTALRQLFH